MPNMREKFEYYIYIFNRLSITKHNNMHFMFLGDSKKNNIYIYVEYFLYQ